MGLFGLFLIMAVPRAVAAEPLAEAAALEQQAVGAFQQERFSEVEQLALPGPRRWPQSRHPDAAASLKAGPQANSNASDGSMARAR